MLQIIITWHSGWIILDDRLTPIESLLQGFVFGLFAKHGSSHLGYAIEDSLLNIPSPSHLPNSENVFPYVFVAFDDAFGLKTHMMKPFPLQNLSLHQRVFNYRLSWARQVIENVFGMAASRFGIFRTPIAANVRKVTLVTKAVVAFHNFIMRIPSRGNKCCPINQLCWSWLTFRIQRLEKWCKKYSQFLEQVLTTIQEMQFQLERALNRILSRKEQQNGSGNWWVTLLITMMPYGQIN